MFCSRPPEALSYALAGSTLSMLPYASQMNVSGF